MSTRAVYTFKDPSGAFSVYKHYDGFPQDAAEFISKARALAWPGLRFEADEFGAAFIAANKNSPGDVRLTKGHTAHSDLSYRYVISQRMGDIWVDAFKNCSVSDKPEYKKIFGGRLDKLAAID